MRCAVFVDAGYLLAGAGDLYLGTSRRAEIGCDAASVTRTLLDVGQERSGLSALRLYWYDAAPHGVPMSDQLEIARLSNVKLRLGRLVGGQQKGVDSLLVRDLMVLGRERAISTAFVVGGDEDLREGIIDAQDRGVEVALLGFPETGAARPAEILIREADAFHALSSELLAPYFTRRARDIRLVPTKRADEIAARGLSSADALGRAFAASWAEGASTEDLRLLLAERPVIPRPLDVQLVTEAERTLGSLREDEERRIELRTGFWEGLADERKTRLT